ncbi:MAG: hypothetical protein AAF488_17150, partial [Planctomycetota bacterium]
STSGPYHCLVEIPLDGLRFEAHGSSPGAAERDALQAAAARLREIRLDQRSAGYAKSDGYARAGARDTIHGS